MPDQESCGEQAAQNLSVIAAPLYRNCIRKEIHAAMPNRMAALLCKLKQTDKAEREDVADSQKKGMYRH